MSSAMEFYYIANIQHSIFIFAEMILLGKQLCSRCPTSSAALVPIRSREVCLKCRTLAINLQVASMARVKKAI